MTIRLRFASKCPAFVLGLLAQALECPNVRPVLAVSPRVCACVSITTNR
jgi:hypothetical protein